ncbi:MAG TPA: hypothetical protein VKZ71_00980 [Burkholderiaceae bacterium]|nr:hypothetical protein [Burkholderiaceae bacterium]
MSIPSSPPGLHPIPTLHAFKEAAADNGEVYFDGQRLVVMAAGETPQGRKVEWVAPSGDAASALTQALENAVGPGLANAIARELNLAPAPGKPLSARTIERAAAMAETGLQALEGVDFLTQLRLSARNATPDFARVCLKAGVGGHQLNADMRQRIDDMLGQRFQLAAQGGHVPVPADKAEQWLADIIKQAVADG